MDINMHLSMNFIGEQNVYLVCSQALACLSCLSASSQQALSVTTVTWVTLMKRYC